MLIVETNLRAKRGLTRLSFDLPSGVRSLSVAADCRGGGYALVVVLNPAGAYVADIALGVSLFPPEAYIAKDRASINAARQEPEPGTYGVIVGYFPADGEEEAEIGVRVAADEPATSIDPADYQDEPWFSSRSPLLDYERMHDPESRYYRGDLHAHTRLSDGENPIRRAIGIAEDRGLDFIAFTEHNRIAAGMPASRVLLVPSYELTLPIGHFNIHGIVRPLFDAGTLRLIEGATSYEALADALLEYHERDGNRSLNHPFLEPWQLRYGHMDLARIDTIELFCDPTYPSSPSANDAAVAFLDALWNSGRRLYGIGGSDSHLAPEERYPGSDLPSIYGDPTTYVYCDGLSIANMLRALRNGHAYVCRLASMDPRIEVDGERVLPGDGIPDHSRLVRYTVDIDDCPPGWSARFVADGRVIREERLTGSSASVALEAPAGGFSWLRFGLVDGAGHEAAYVNPVYTGQRARASGPFAPGSTAAGTRKDA